MMNQEPPTKGMKSYRYTETWTPTSKYQRTASAPPACIACSTPITSLFLDQSSQPLLRRTREAARVLKSAVPAPPESPGTWSPPRQRCQWSSRFRPPLGDPDHSPAV